MLSRSVQPKRIAEGTNVAQGAALTCIASTPGVVIPPSLVLILLGDAPLRAPTEAINLTAVSASMSTSVRIINTQDVFHGAVIPATMLLLLFALVAWFVHRRAPHTDTQSSAVSRVEIVLALLITAFFSTLLVAVALGHRHSGIFTPSSVRPRSHWLVAPSAPMAGLRLSHCSFRKRVSRSHRSTRRHHGAQSHS